ncbi:MAG: hypothetical protein IPO45_15390 [Saprospiraceae bacterium]|nr:hypothetical protein [Candidatus Brachybacter algidus]
MKLRSLFQNIKIIYLFLFVLNFCIELSAQNPQWRTYSNFDAVEAINTDGNDVFVGSNSAGLLKINSLNGGNAIY